MPIDWSRIGKGPAPEDLCPEDGCDHAVYHLGYTPRHRWNLHCSDGQWWKGCDRAGLPVGYPDRCLCKGCKPRHDKHTRRLTLRSRRKCRCDPERARAEAENRQEEGST